MLSELPARLKAATRALHGAAERNPLMVSLLRGQLPRAAYCSLLRNLHPIYAALETSLARHARHPALAPALLPGLQRTATVEQDLLALHGSGWSDGIGLQRVAVQYAQRLATVEPPLLLAHAYVRYLGDLSGGQVLRTIVARSLGLNDGRGTAFYDFGDAQQTHQLTQAFRAALAAVDLDASATEAVVGEAQLAFRMHQALFDGLARQAAVQR